MSQTAEIRRYRSNPIKGDLRKAFKKYVNSFQTRKECAEDLGVSEVGLSNIYGRMTARWDTFEKIKEKTSAANVSKFPLSEN